MGFAEKVHPQAQREQQRGGNSFNCQRFIKGEVDQCQQHKNEVLNAHVPTVQIDTAHDPEQLNGGTVDQIAVHAQAVGAVEGPAHRGSEDGSQPGKNARLSEEHQKLEQQKIT